MPGASPLHLIGQAAALSGVSTPSFRFYEKQGLLAPGARSANRYRSYSGSDIHQFILFLNHSENRREAARCEDCAD